MSHWGISVPVVTCLLLVCWDLLHLGSKYCLIACDCLSKYNRTMGSPQQGTWQDPQDQWVPVHNHPCCSIVCSLDVLGGINQHFPSQISGTVQGTAGLGEYMGYAHTCSDFGQLVQMGKEVFPDRHTAQVLVKCSLLDSSPAANFSQHTQFCSGIKGGLWDQADVLQAVRVPCCFLVNSLPPLLRLPSTYFSLFSTFQCSIPASLPPRLIFPKCSNSPGTNGNSHFLYPRLFLFIACKFLLIHSLIFLFTLLLLSVFGAMKLPSCMFLLSWSPSTHSPFLLVLLCWCVFS